MIVIGPCLFDFTKAEMCFSIGPFDSEAFSFQEETKKCTGKANLL